MTLLVKLDRSIEKRSGKKTDSSNSYEWDKGEIFGIIDDTERANNNTSVVNATFSSIDEN